MKRISPLLLLLVLLVSCRKPEDLMPEYYECNLGFADSSAVHPNHAAYQGRLDEMTANGVVGVSMAVHDNTRGMWLGTSGKADLHNDVAMKPCTILRMGSTVKMFTATVVLMLVEEGRLSLDDRLSEHLQGEFMEKIKQADVATIRQLLRHSSGIYNYIQNLEFQTASLNDLIRPWEAEDLLQYAYGKEPYFAPGSDVSYSNTNYILLGLLIEHLEGKPLHEVFDERIFAPLGLMDTQFAGKNPVPEGIARGYIDIYSNLQVIEGTYYSGWDYYTADGGLISTPYDLNVFFRALMQGQLLSGTSLDEMLDWQVPSVQDPGFYEIAYGMGIFRMTTERGLCYFHSGDAIGYYANMMYFPEDSTTIVYAVNSNYGLIDEFVSSKVAIGKLVAR
ncbi:MAG: serine hydrolase domain-containing protein [Bacteroidia bacterium]